MKPSKDETAYFLVGKTKEEERMIKKVLRRYGEKQRRALKGGIK
jgi:hypothetical protein